MEGLEVSAFGLKIVHSQVQCGFDERDACGILQDIEDDAHPPTKRRKAKLRHRERFYRRLQVESASGAPDIRSDIEHCHCFDGPADDYGT
jgi:hypothetical protein